MSDAILTGDGATMLADQALCVRVGEDLARAYPGYQWMVGCNHEAGTVVIDLLCDKPIGLANYGYLLHISSLMGAGGQAKVMRAGGELLERFGLRRGSAQSEWKDQAVQNGLDLGNAVLKSRH